MVCVLVSAKTAPGSGRRRASGGFSAAHERFWQRLRRRRGLLLEGLDEDALDAAHVDEVDLERAAAGGVEAGGGVALGQAQQLVALPQLRPGQRPLEEPLGEGAGGLAEFGRAPLQLLGRAQRVGAELGRVVVAVGGRVRRGAGAGGP